MKISFYIIFICFLLQKCNNGKTEIDCLLDNSGKNRSKFKKIINHFTENHDTLGLLSAIHILKNIDDKLFLNKAEELCEDKNYIKAEYLIRDIDNACKISKHDIISGNITLNSFKEYILPYKIGYASTYDWRTYCRKKFREQCSGKSPNEMCKIINDSIGKNFQFSYAEKHAFYKNWNELYNSKKGDCWTMTTLALYPVRAMGLPSAIDYVDTWSNVDGGGHAWNVMIEKNKVTPFMGCETSPPNYNPFSIYNQKRIPAKVYRLTYSKNPKRIRDYLKNDEFTPSIFLQENKIDVTSNYLKTKTVRIKDKSSSSKKLRYLAIYTKNKWKDVDWSNSENNVYTFYNISIHSLYIQSEYTKDKRNNISHPFYFSDGKIKSLEINFNKKINICLKNIGSKSTAEINAFKITKNEKMFHKRMDNIYYNSVYSPPKAKISYSLHYWNKEWKLLNNSISVNGSLTFTNLPTNTLYKVSESAGEASDRIFIIHKNKVVWF